MSFCEWSTAYVTGNEDIDYQHQRLFQMVNDLYDSINSNSEIEMRILLEVFLERLVEYVDFHFKHEEELMSKTHYEDFATHKAIHDKLRTQVLDFQKQFKNETANISNDLMAFLKDWLVNHIQKTDTKLAAHVGHAH